MDQSDYCHLRSDEEMVILCRKATLQDVTVH